MNRKISFDVGIADDFDETDRWPTAIGTLEAKSIDIEFDFLGGNVMDEAEKALKEYMLEHYSDKKYKIYYWTWLD